MKSFKDLAALVNRDVVRGTARHDDLDSPLGMIVLHLHRLALGAVETGDAKGIPAATMMGACKEILDRTEGKATAPKAVSGGDSPEPVTEIGYQDILALIEALAQAVPLGLFSSEASFGDVSEQQAWIRILVRLRETMRSDSDDDDEEAEDTSH